MAVVPKQSGVDVLRKLVPLSTLSDEALEKLYAAAKFTKISKGNVLFREGDQEPLRIYLLSGRISLTRKGKEADLISAGDNVARYPLAHDVPRKYTATAKTRSEIVVLDNRLLGDLLAEASNSTYEVEEVDSELTDDWMSQLLKSPVFQQIPASNIQQVMMHMEEFLVVAGQVVIQEGDEGDYFYLINSGTALVSRATDSGSIEELARLGPGATFGEESLLSGAPRGGTVTMLTDGTLLRLDKEHFIQFVKHPLAQAITFDTALEQVNAGAVWLDVRSDAEREKIWIPDSLHIPFKQLRSRVSELEDSKTYIVHCQDGVVSASAVYLLLDKGYEANVLSRGLQAVPEEHLGYADKSEASKVVDIRAKAESDVASSEAEPVDEEADLLRHRLQVTENQVKEQILHTRKMKLLIDKLKDHIAGLEQEKADSLELQAKQKSELTKLRSSLRKLESEQEQLRESVNEGSGYKTQLDDARLELENAEADRRAEKLAAEKQLKALQDRLDELEQSHGESHETLQLQLKSKTEEALQLQQKQADSEQSIEGLRKQLDELKQQLDLEKQRTADLSGELEQAGKTAGEQQAMWERQQQEAQAEIEKLSQQLDDSKKAASNSSQLVGELDALREEHAALKQQMESSEREKADLETRYQAVQEELSGFHQQLEAAQQAQSDAEEALEKSREMQQKQSEALSTQVGQISELTGERDRLRREHDEAQQQLQTLRQQLDQGTDADQKLAELSRSHEELQHKSEQLEQALEKAKEQHQEEIAGRELLEQETSELRQQLEAAAESSVDAAAIDALRSELDEALAEKQAVEQALQQAQSEPDKASKSELSALQAELDTLNQALDEADQSYEELQKQYKALEQQSQEQAATAEQMVDPEELERLNAELAALQSQLQQQQAAAEKETLSLHDRLEEAQSTLSQQGDSSALIVDLQQQLEEVQQQLKEREVTSSANAAENEVLRQELDALRKSLDERRVELENSYQESALLEERIEERNGEIDRLTATIEAAEQDLKVANDERQTLSESQQELEAAIEKLQRQVIVSSSESELVDMRLHQSALDIDPEPAAPKRLMAPAIAAVVAFAIAEVLSIAGGGGELISGLLSGTTPAVVEQDRPEETAPAVEPSTVTTEQKLASSTMAKRVQSAEPEESEQVAVPKQPPDSTKKTAPAVPQSTAVTSAALSSAPRPVAQAQAVQQPLSEPEPQPQPAPEVIKPEPKLIRDSLRSGGLAPEMVFVPGGRFIMGSDRSQLANEERPAHSVQVPGFAIGRYEVTFNDYERFARDTGRLLPNDQGWGRGSRPVIHVSWEDANQYAEWLSAQTGERYRLPTEAEWEYAAAAGTDTLYWWGFNLGENRANCFNCGSQWDRQSTAPVGQFAANGFGLYNTAGNVMEWVSDCYHGDYYGAPNDGSAWDELGCQNRVVRGGAFNKPGESLRTTKRTKQDAASKSLVVGFRLVREVDN